MSCPCGLTREECIVIHHRVTLVGGKCQNPLADGSDGVCGRALGAVLGKPPGVVRWGEPPGVRVPFAHGGVANCGTMYCRALCRHNPLLGGVVIRAKFKFKFSNLKFLLQIGIPQDHIKKFSQKT